MTRFEIMAYLYVVYINYCHGYLTEAVYMDRVAALRIEWEFAKEGV